jgi:hypothetical protein
MPDLRKPYLLFLGEETQVSYAKTAFGLRDWARDSCIGQWAPAGLLPQPPERGLTRSL